MKRIPWWAVVFAFAALVGGGIGLYAYLRGRSHDPTAYCTRYLPTKLLAQLAGHALSLETRGRIGDCTAIYRGAKSIEVSIARRTKDPVDARLRAIAAATNGLAPTPLGLPGADAYIFETTVQATKPHLVGLVAVGDDVIELGFDPAVFTGDAAREVMRETAAKVRDAR